MSVEMITKEQFLRVLPAHVRNRVDDDMLDSINNHLSTDAARAQFRDNLISYTSVLKDGRFKLTDYVSAVKFVTFQLLGDSNVVAYAKTFPDRYQELVNKGASDKTISSYVCAFAKNKLVALITEQSVMPAFVFNQDKVQKAINVLADLMANENVNPRDRVAAATSLLTQLKPPEVAKVQLEVGVKEDSAIAALRAQTAILAKQQQDLISAGVLNVKTVANTAIVIEGEAEEV